MLMHARPCGGKGEVWYWVVIGMLGCTDYITDPRPFSSMSLNVPHSTSPAKWKLILLLLFGMHTGMIRVHS